MTILDDVPRRRFTRDEYYRMGEQGFFENQRVQLIEGEILVMSPQKDPHASTVALLTRLFVKALPDEYVLRPQLPLSISDDSEPEPDIAIVTNEPGVKRGEHPCTAKLVVEIADSSLRLDKAKANLYASAEVPEYWIVDLNSRKLHVYTEPVSDRKSKTGSSYAILREFAVEETVTPVAVPLQGVKVGALFPA